MEVVKLRTYVAPAAAGGGSYTLDELEMLSQGEDALGIWAGRTYRRERDATLERLNPADSKLPTGVTDTDEFGHEYVLGLKYESGVYTAEGWADADALVASGTWMQLSADDAAFVARAFDSGIDRVYFRPFMPVGWLGGAVTAAGAPDPALRLGLPEGAIIAAVVDELDKNAVLDLIAVAPGPVTMRRHDGEWREDDAWVHALRSVKPPPLVKIDDEALLGSVVAQIDTATQGKPFSKDEEEAEEDAPASPLVAALVAADIESAIAAALVAAPTPKGAAGAERLRQYWLHGKGAAKIRWGTPGDWTRCYKNLSKYLGTRAKGYCQLMHGRATGKWAGRNQENRLPSAKVKAEAVAKQLAK